MAQAWTVPGLRGTARFRDAAGRIILTRWAEMMSYRDGTMAGEDIEELHAMRVSSRRLRAAMDAFAAAFPPKSFNRYLRRVKEITDTLGEARDLDVAIEALTGLLGDVRPDERAGIEGLVARYRQNRGEEDARIAAVFARLEEDDFERRFTRYIERHTGVGLRSLHPRAPKDER
ncbi:MAG: CHAD domain-containing protein [Thermoleophilia bacterium]|jgi:CHAD domain-containing protein